MAADIQIEKVEVDVSSDGQTYTLANDVGSLNKAFVRIMGGTPHGSAGPTNNTGNVGPKDIGVGVELTGTDELTFYLSGTNVGPCKMMLEVWRYTGPAGGEYEFITRMQGSMVVAAGGSSQTHALAGHSNRNKCVPIHCGFVSLAGGTGNFEDIMFALHINSSSQVVASRNNTGAETTVYFTVVEFTGSCWNVGYGKSANHDAAMEVVTLNTDSDGVSGSTFDTTDWGTAMILDVTMEGDTAETGISDVLAMAWPAASTSQVNFSVVEGDITSRNDGVAYIHVLQCDDLLMVRSDEVEVFEGNGSYGTDLPAPIGIADDVAYDDISLEWFPDTSGTGPAQARGQLHAQIEEFTGASFFSQGSPFNSSDYDQTQYAWFDFLNVYFNDVFGPQGLLIEAGGTGIGMAMGFNGDGNLVARAGAGNVLDPDDGVRIEVTPAMYNFEGKTGKVRLIVDPLFGTITFRFDENSTGTWDYTITKTSVSGFSSWSGGADGGIGYSPDGNVAGSEFPVTDFNGSIFAVIFKQVRGNYIIRNWIHRSGNAVSARYGVADFSAMNASVTVDVSTINTKTPAQIVTLNTKTTAQIGTLNTKTL